MILKLELKKQQIGFLKIVLEKTNLLLKIFSSKKLCTISFYSSSEIAVSDGKDYKLFFIPNSIKQFTIYFSEYSNIIKIRKYDL